MLAILSPAKSLNLTDAIVSNLASQPIFEADRLPIVQVLKKMKPHKIAETFHLSQKLAELNYERYQAMGTKENLKQTRQAVFTFDGDVYQGLDAYHLDKKYFPFAQEHIRILSGLYGVLKPFDFIEPYRLEMGSNIKIGKYKNLYAFWQERLTNYFNNELENHKTKVLLNLASNEYSKAIDFKKLNAEVIEFEFLELDKKELKNISFYSKKARGLMARYIIENKLENPKDLVSFDYERYTINKKLSSEFKQVFTRKFQPIGKKTSS